MFRKLNNVIPVFKLGLVGARNSWKELPYKLQLNNPRLRKQNSMKNRNVCI